MALSPRAARFVALFVQTGNATQAYVDAGYKPGASVTTTGAYACRLQKKAEVSAAIVAASARQAKRLDLTMERVLAEVYVLAFSNIGAAVDPGSGRLLKLHEMPAFLQHAVQEYTEDVLSSKDGETVTRRKVKLHAKWPALERMLRLSGVEQLLGVDESRAKAAKRARVRVTLPDGTLVEAMG